MVGGEAITALVAAASLSVVTACSSDEPETAADPSTSASTSASPSASSSSSSVQDKDVVASPPSKSWEDAVEAARDDFDGKVNKIELEKAQGGGLEYKIEQVSATEEHEVQYDANSLEQVSEDTDALGGDAAEEQQKAFDPGELIDLDEAVTTARGQVDGTITKWKVEGEDTGRVIYEFDILPAGSSPGDEDREVQVDARDGAIVQDS